MNPHQEGDRGKTMIMKIPQKAIEEKAISIGNQEEKILIMIQITMNMDREDITIATVIIILNIVLL